MATVAAIRSNPVIRAFYERLIKAGKFKKVAITACIRKLLTIYLSPPPSPPFAGERGRVWELNLFFPMVSTVASVCDSPRLHPAGRLWFYAGRSEEDPGRSELPEQFAPWQR